VDRRLRLAVVVCAVVCAAWATGAIRVGPADADGPLVVGARAEGLRAATLTIAVGPARR
jgi:hypothetical protein